MAKKQYTLTGQDRNAKVNVIRRQGSIPAVLYGHGVEPRSLQVARLPFLKTFREAGSTTLVSLQLDDKADHPVLIRELQFHPVSGDILHVDLYQVRMDEKITANVPVHFVGEAPAVKDHGGVLVRNLDEVEVWALPQDLPHDIEVDISLLDNFDKVIAIKDLEVGGKVEILNHEPEDVVALVQPPRTQEEIDEELSEPATEDVESVEGVKDKEPEEGEGESEDKKE